MEVTQFLFEGSQVAVDPVLDERECAWAVLQLGRPHLDDLPAASDQRFQFTGGSRDQRLSYDTAHLTEVGDHSGVDAVRLCELALRAGEVTNLTGVDDGNRDTGGSERGGQGIS